MRMTIDGPGAHHPRRTRPRGPMTEVKIGYASTFAAPVADPGGRTRPESWSAVSLDGLWAYERVDVEATPWSVTYLPTGQTCDSYRTLDDAREATAGPLLDELRRVAMSAAYQPGDPANRAAGQRWLAIHLRLAGATAVDVGCLSCGGLLAVIATDGRFGHVDACSVCRDSMDVGCHLAGDHRFCADPEPALTPADQQILDLEGRHWPRCGAKVDAIRNTSWSTTTRYYQRLNQLIGGRAALAADPVLVNRLLRQRDTRPTGNPP
jgi:hypothetical protein